MRQRSNLTILLGVAFLLIGGAIVFLVLNDSDDGSPGGSSTALPDVTVLVAAVDIPAGTLGSDVIEQQLLRTETVTAGTQPAGALTSAAGLDNQIFAASVEEGTTITAAQLTIRSLSNIPIPDGFDGVSVTLDYTAGGAGYIAPGDTINVYGRFDNPDGPDTLSAGLARPAEGATPMPRVELILTNVLVLDVSSQDPTSGVTQVDDRTTINRPTSAGTLTFLLAMKPTDIERLVLVSEHANMYFSLTADDAPIVGDTPGSDGRTVAGPVSADSAPAPQG